MTRRSLSRRKFCTHAAALAALAGLSARGGVALHGAASDPSLLPRLGLVTYLWGRDWDLPTLLANCERAGLEGVELRTEHAHGVEPSLNANQRAEVRKRFADSPVKYVGLGSNENFDSPDPAEVRRHVENAKAFIKLAHDTGTSGVKVKPNDLHEGIPPEQTIAQIGRALHALGDFAKDHGQQIRVEAHGTCAPLDIMRSIMQAADHDHVRLCWNCNAQDVQGDGLDANFALVKDFLGETLHIHELERPAYPYARLFELLRDARYSGWMLLECSTSPGDRVAAMIEQRRKFDELLAAAAV